MELIGREAEFERIGAFVESAGSGATALVIDGEAGIGKTALWREAVRKARSGGMTVLACRPVEAEAPLAFAGLGDLLAGVVDEVLPELPAPQRKALEIALLRGENETATVDPRAVGSAVATTFAKLAERRPLLVAVDDVPWLDSSTANVLTFALRRMDEHPVRVLLARRTSERSALPLGLDTAFATGTVERMTVGPLSLRELHRLFSADLGRPLARPLLVRIAQAAGGNPLFALEIGRALDRSGAQPKPGEPLPVPGRLRDLLTDRIAALTTGERSVLLLAAASANPTELLLRSRPGGAEAIERAEDLGLVELDGGRVLFSHPLLASTVYGMATTTQRRTAHGVLAEAADDPEDKARHLALAVAVPDEDVADALEKAASAATRRGAAAAATELLELAVRRTPEAANEERWRRQLVLARHRFRDGDASAASQLAREVRARTANRSATADALLLEAEIAFESGLDSVTELSAEAIRVAGDDPHLAARAYAIAANVEYNDMEVALAHVEQALKLLDSLPEVDPDTTALALRASVGTRLILGQGFDRAGAERSYELERIATVPLRVSERPSSSRGVWFSIVDDLPRARAALEETYQTVLDEGDDSSLPYILGHLSTLEWREGNWDRARAFAAEQLEIAEAAGQSQQRGAALYRLAVVDVSRGEVTLGRSEAEEALLLALDQWEERRAEWVLGFLALSLGDFATATARLGRADELGRLLKLREPGVRQESLELAEALVGLGELDRARALVDEYEAVAVRLDRPSGLAVSARVRGLVLSASGSHVEAVDVLRSGLSQHERVRLPFELGRAYLALGQIERRQRHKKLAQDALLRAEAQFVALGARLWVDRTRAEQARLGLRRRDPNALTDTERRVAELAATGLTNRQVAKELFMSPRTVEAHIGKIYTKLGIRSRAELGRALDEQG